MPATAVTAAAVSDDPQVYEDEHVHAVYDEIAPHFSSTRYKPWPIIADFLGALPSGWVGLDSGTGNGKYLPLPLERPGSVWTVGLDRSRNLLDIARRGGGVLREVVWGDVLDRPWRDGAFDYAISIATIHHLSTHVRRKVAVQRLLQSVSPAHGRILIYVWAIEQDEQSKRKIPTQLESEETQSQGQDVFVPWVFSSPAKPTRRPESFTEVDASPEDSTTTHPRKPSPKIFNRYYHMFGRGELAGLVREAAVELGLHMGAPPTMIGENAVRRGIEIVQDGWERSNYYVEVRCWVS
ncbi:S-adenosyl-L-methionine-dependent methyltransferase [Amylocystis lapponica]|nr:S-adenosyl-L-methionine-dependent methyltransferase [Amylocystis lapponica]